MNKVTTMINHRSRNFKPRMVKVNQAVEKSVEFQVDEDMAANAIAEAASLRTARTVKSDKPEKAIMKDKDDDTVLPNGIKVAPDAIDMITSLAKAAEANQPTEEEEDSMEEPTPASTEDVVAELHRKVSEAVKTAMGPDKTFLQKAVFIAGIVRMRFL